MKNSFCHKCKLYTSCLNPCLPNLQTAEKCNILIIGDYTNSTDDKQGRIWSHSDQKMFLQYVHSLNETYAVTNVVRCTPYKFELRKVRGKEEPQEVRMPAKPTPGHKKNCLPRLYQYIDQIKPKVIITVGSYATNTLLNLGISIDKARGVSYYHPEFNAYVVPMLDCDMYSTDSIHLQFLKSDLNIVKQILNTRGIRKICAKPKSLKDPVEIKNYLLSLFGAEYVAYDLETTGLNPRKDRITDISFCSKPGEGIHIKWNDILPYLDLFKQLMLKENIKWIGQNIKFDRTHLMHNHIDTALPFLDTMLGYHTLTMMHESGGGGGGGSSGMYTLERMAQIFTHQGDYKSILQQWGGISKYQQSINENNDEVIEQKPQKEKKTILQKKNELKKEEKKKEVKQKVVARLPLQNEFCMFSDPTEELESNTATEESDFIKEYLKKYEWQKGNELIESLMNRSANKGPRIPKAPKDKMARESLAKKDYTLELDEVEEAQLNSYLDFPAQIRAKKLEELGLTPLEYYSALDADVTLQIGLKLEPLLKEQYAFVFWDLIMPLNDAIMRMEATGTLLDVPYVNSMIESHKIKQAEEAKKIFSFVGKEFNIDSNDELSEVIYKDLKISPNPKFMTKGGKSGVKKPSVDVGAIEFFASQKGCEGLKHILDYRSYGKEISTYFEGFLKLLDPVSGRIHGSFTQINTATGRLASSNPNLQNIPRANYVRNMIIPSPGCKLVGADLSQAELRILSMVADDKAMQAGFDSGFDFHVYTASSMFGIPLDEFDHKNNKKHAELRSASKCVHPGTLICVDGQIKRIGNVVIHAEFDSFKDTAYQKVWDGKQYVDLKSTYKSVDDERLLVVTRRGAFACSKKHQILLEDGSLVQAQNLQVGHILKQSSKVEVESRVQYVYYNPVTETSIGGLKLELTSGWAYIAGLFTGDGTASVCSVSITSGIGGKYNEWLDIIEKSFHEIGIPAKKRDTRPYQSLGDASVYIGSVRVCRLFDIMGLVTYTPHRCARTYRIPEWVFNNTDLGWSFLGGLIDTDGSISTSDSVTILTKSWELLQDICVLLNVLGLSFTTLQEYNKQYNKYYYSVRILAENLPLLNDKNVLRCPWKKQILEERAERIRLFNLTHHKRQDTTKPCEVLRIENIGVGVLVDLEVNTEEHMYWMSGFEGHNTINFGIAYGRKAPSIAQQVGCSIDEAEEFMNKFFKSYPQVKQWIGDTISTARRTGYVETVHGRRRYLPYINSSDQLARSHAENQAINTPIQGTASDCACYGLIRVTDYVLKNNYKARPVMIIHDEIQMDTPDDEVAHFAEKLPYFMTQNIPLITVPLVSDATILEKWEKG